MTTYIVRLRTLIPAFCVTRVLYTSKAARCGKGQSAPLESLEAYEYHAEYEYFPTGDILRPEVSKQMLYVGKSEKRAWGDEDVTCVPA